MMNDFNLPANGRHGAVLDYIVQDAATMLLTNCLHCSYSFLE